MPTVPRPLRQTEAPPAAKAGILTVVSDRFSLIVPPEAYTLSGFRAWATADDFPEHVRVTFLEGEILLDMSNEEMEGHVNPKGEITRVLMNLCRDLKIGKVYADGLLLSHPEAGVSNNPDALFFTGESLRTHRVRPVPKKGADQRYVELEGTPDWVLEVLSDSSVQKDAVRLREAYHRAGIPEYWLVDARREEIVFQILLRRKNNYVAAPEKDGWQRSKVFARSFRLDRALDDLGLLEYTLHVHED